jgi:GntR family transcriptional regulator, rspAB operon transcriptional repressor
MVFPELKLKIEPPVSIRDRIYDYIKQEILSDKIPEDAILVETRLAEQMGVSRTPIREALHFLEKEGLLELLPRAGYRLRRIDWDEFEEIVQIRKVVEALAAGWAITRIKPEELEALKENVQQSGATIQQGDLSVFPELDAQFHEILARASGSKRLIDLIQLLRSDMLRYRLKSLHRADHASLALDGHCRIFQCVLERNSSGLEDAVRDHLDKCRETMRLYAFDDGESRLHTDSET